MLILGSFQGIAMKTRIVVAIATLFATQMLAEEPLSIKESNAADAKYAEKQKPTRLMFVIENEGQDNPQFFKTAKMHVQRRLMTMVRKGGPFSSAEGRSFGIIVVQPDHSRSFSHRSSSKYEPISSHSMCACNPMMTKLGIEFLADVSKAHKQTTVQMMNELNRLNQDRPTILKPWCQRIIVLTDGDFPSRHLLKDSDATVEIVKYKKPAAEKSVPATSTAKQPSD